jgi:hypothetical protein
MKAQVIPNATALVLGVALLGGSSVAGAQTVVVRPGERPAPPPEAPLVVVNGGAPAVVPEPVVAPEPVAAVRLITRPNRAGLITGLVTFGQSYIASVGIAATSRHRSDWNLWIPALGPWLDLGARPGCPKSNACGGEMGNRVLLVADGLLQTFGAFQILGAFLWPETIGVPAVVTPSGSSWSLRPSKIGRDGYGLVGIGHF